MEQIIKSKPISMAGAQNLHIPCTMLNCIVA